MILDLRRSGRLIGWLYVQIGCTRRGSLKSLGGTIIDKHKLIACGHLRDVEARDVGAVDRQGSQ